MMVTSLSNLHKWIEKQMPPRPGLVPKSGDPRHPYRWVRPDQPEAKKTSYFYEMGHRQAQSFISNLWENVAPVVYQEEEVEAIDNYIGYDFLHINKLLREGRLARIYKKFEEKTRSNIKNMRIALKKWRTPEDFRVFRVLSKRNKELAIGQEYSDNAFLSTTLSKQVVLRLAGEYGRYGIGSGTDIFSINLPKNSSAILGSDEEAELILAPNTKLRITKIQFDDADRRWISAEVIQ